MRFWKRVNPPEPNDGRPSYEEQLAELNRLSQAMKDGSMTSEEIGLAAIAMGPVRGSFGDYVGSRCHHMAPYPGCRGGCAR